MKIIDLLNKMANGEEVPDAIKWGCHNFEWFVYEYKAKGELGEPTLLDYLSQCPKMLNDEIITFYKIEEEKKIPEKLEDYDFDDGLDANTKCECLRKRMQEIENQLDEIIDYLESKGV